MASFRYFGVCVLWCCCVPLFPILVLQARMLRRRIPKLKQASGPMSSEVGASFTPLHLAIIGESTTVGLGARSLDRALPGGLVSELRSKFGAPIAWRLYGRDGATIQNILQVEVPKMIAPMDMAIVVLGVNDVFQLTSSKNWMARLRRLTAHLQGLGCRQVIYSQVPPIGRFPALPWLLRRVLSLRVYILNYGLRRWSRQQTICAYAEIEFAREKRFMARDGVHPSEEGYLEWSRQLASWLQHPEQKPSSSNFT